MCKIFNQSFFNARNKDKSKPNIWREKLCKSQVLLSLIEIIFLGECAREFILCIYWFTVRQTVRKIDVDIKQLISNQFSAFERAATSLAYRQR